MAKEIFLTNENYVRGITLIDNNLPSKYLQSAIREAQETGLQEITGTALLNKIKGLVNEGTIDDTVNAAYKNLLERSQLYLAYQSVVHLCLATNVKISAGGLQQTSDENLAPISLEDTWNVQEHYQKKADFYARRLQSFIYENRADYPELGENKCHELHANLHSSATTGLWLGGARGKR